MVQIPSSGIGNSMEAKIRPDQTKARYPVYQPNKIKVLSTVWIKMRERERERERITFICIAMHKSI
jgi:hypothetical protein